ncbi:MAG: dihydrodipicolinate reductase C-terminal domain-containing protein [Cetobacterium sp.]
MKVACTVWSRGKGGDNFKALPIAIITHKALSKKIFAVGALKCAEILKNKKSGLYTMEDMF